MYLHELVQCALYPVPLHKRINTSIWHLEQIFNITLFIEFFIFYVDELDLAANGLLCSQNFNK